MIALLLTHRPNDETQRLVPTRIERGSVAGLLPVCVRQPDGVAERVQFPLPKSNAGVHNGIVVYRPDRGCRGLQIGHKGVGVWIDQNAPALAPNDPSSSAWSLSSFAASGRYRHICADGSRSHMASMSPVMTTVSGLPSKVPP